MLSKIEELKLVTRCTLFDDRDAFGRLVEEYQSEMRRFFLNMSGGNAALSDEPPDNRERTDDARMDVAVALKALNETERSITILFYMEDKPIKDIVAITSLPEGTVKSHLSRAKSKLADFFGKN